MYELIRVRDKDERKRLGAHINSQATLFTLDSFIENKESRHFKNGFCVNVQYCVLYRGRAK